MPSTLTLERLTAALAGHAAAFRCQTTYQPAGGLGDKVFPPTYEGGKYATERRIDPATGNMSPCVLLDSVQSQANRMELALLAEHRAGRIELPLLTARFDDERLTRPFAINSLEAPHRVADALFRDCVIEGVTFRRSPVGAPLDQADLTNATSVFALCPTALVFGMWDSSGPRGGLGAKFQRAIVSEIVGYDAQAGIATGGKVDTIPIRTDNRIYQRAEIADDQPLWTLNPELAKIEKKKPVTVGKEGKPSNANLGGVTPDIAYARNQKQQIETDALTSEDGTPLFGPNDRPLTRQRIKGGFTISRAEQRTVLSLATLRRQHFPASGEIDFDAETDLKARTALAAIGLAAATFVRRDGDLRSRCQLVAQDRVQWELLDEPGTEPERFALPASAAVQLANDAITAARDCGLPWHGEISLTPTDELLELVIRSQQQVIEADTGSE
ncbi:MAG: type I-U CRISPR-associated protein Cas7 [Gammaproteobacteria bacterium]|nr:type I-U CRISPR-associated protein Cas7 [Gammaproteobacteria bacterium]